MVGRERGKRWEREGGNELDREQLHGLGGVNSKGEKQWIDQCSISQFQGGHTSEKQSQLAHCRVGQAPLSGSP